MWMQVKEAVIKPGSWSPHWLGFPPFVLVLQTPPVFCLHISTGTGTEQVETGIKEIMDFIYLFVFCNNNNV